MVVTIPREYITERVNALRQELGECFADMKTCKDKKKLDQIVFKGNTASARLDELARLVNFSQGKTSSPVPSERANPR